MSSVTPQLKFAAILTVLLVGSVQIASLAMVFTAAITAQEYLAIWVPIMTLSGGYWFGRQTQGGA